MAERGATYGRRGGRRGFRGGHVRGRGRGGGRGGGHFHGRDKYGDEGCVEENYDRGACGRRQREEDSAPGSSTQQKKKPIGFRKLQELQNEEPIDIILILTNRGGIRELLEDGNMNQERLALLLAALAKGCECTTRPESLIKLLNVVVTSSLLDNIIVTFIVKMQVEVSVHRQEKFQKPIKDMLRLFKELLTRLPNSIDKVTIPLAILDKTISVLTANSTIIDAEITRALGVVNGMNDDIMTRRRERQFQPELEDTPVEFQPPDDFRSLPIFPDIQDIHLEDTPFLRANKVRGGYEDMDHYLDVQFRLMREDYIKPLRDGIEQYLYLKGAKDPRYRDIHIYNNVHIMCPVCTPSGLVYKVTFDTTRLKNVRWEASKRLIFGSLLCLSKDDFTTLFFGTVSNRKPKDLAEGLLEVRFENNQNMIHKMSPSDTFVMAETTAYFEAYRHVLKGLQEISEEDFPFQKYIVKCESKVAPPRYLAKAGRMVNYDLRPLIDEHVKAKVKPIGDLSSDEYDSDVDAYVGSSDDGDYHVFSIAAERARQVPILNTKRWPSAGDLHLDESQLKALQTALTKEMAIIQGPPGTGKTYIGLKIVRALIHNRQKWGGKSPILIVCYTNHALDQFLEGILKFQDKAIVRVGGRSSSKLLEKFYLRNLKADLKQHRKVPKAIFQALNDARGEMKTVESRIEAVTAKIDATRRGIVSGGVLETYMTRRQFKSLEDELKAFQQEYSLTTDRTVSSIVQWLGLGNVNFEPVKEQEEKKTNENPKGASKEAEQEEDDDEDFDVEEEAEAIANQRIIDDEEMEDAKDKTEQALSLMDVQDLALTLEDVKDANKYSALDADDGNSDGGWQFQGLSKHKKNQLIKKILRSPPMSKSDAVKVGNVWHLKAQDRWRLYQYWVTQYCSTLKSSIQQHEDHYEEISKRLGEIKSEEDLNILRQATVIGMTTTGAAKYRRLLQDIQPKIIIVEEAAEVLEAHIVTTLSKGCEHFILIGDHKQLRPNPTVYQLAVQYNLEISLFERMVENNVKVECLELQHRMRPQIATLMSHIYNNLRDHDSVKGFEDIKGLRQNMFFIDHREPETQSEETKSRSNDHEAHYMIALCRHLLLQGYKQSQITILTTYTRQLFNIKNIIKKKQYQTLFQGVRVTAVDNFQGEENDIILLSLVRSNGKGSMGFLSIQNRVCVALSRARMGFYVIGNFTQLLSKNELWSQIIADLRSQQAIGHYLTLVCQNHPESSKINAIKAKDFNKAPEGGCMKPCEVRLNCGHACKLVCHVYDREHKEIKCREPCQKVVCERGHKCHKFCSQPCGNCRVKVMKTIPRCGHDQEVPCHEDPFLFKCLHPCDHILPCGHTCSKKCHEEHVTNCRKVVERQWPCGHIVKTYCSETPETHPCPQKCVTLLSCGHPCPGTCGACKQGRLHVSCTHLCGRTLVCGHSCKQPCTNNCPPCTMKCQNRCVHSRCSKVCGEGCVPCHEQCAWQCKHFRCSMLCSEPCDRPPCNEPCHRQLRCGHHCIGLCGEPCPSVCRICNKDKVTEIFFGEEDEPDARFVQLEDCGHVLEVSGLDHWMAMAEDQSDRDIDIQLKGCPRCKTPIRRNLRYGSVINKVLADIEQVKGKIIGDEMDILLAQQQLLKELNSNAFASDYTATQDLHDFIGSPSVTREQLAIVECQVKFLKSIHEQKVSNKKRSIEERGFNNQAVLLNNELKELRSWIFRPRVRMSEQEINEFNLELERVSLLCDQRWLEFNLNKPGASTLDVMLQIKFNEANKILTDGKALTDSREEKVRGIHGKVKKTLCVPGLGISNEERKMILKAMEFSIKGHWYKCPNGHVYAIGDCGGATTESKCPECHSTIGGTSHRLRDDNRVATEMDGAQYPAFSEQAHLGNYRLDFDDDDF